MRSKYFGLARRLAAPILASISALVLVVIWQVGFQPGRAVLVSVINATLFLAIGLIVRDAGLYKSPYRNFRRMFRGINERRLETTREAYQVVLPHFEINGSIREQSSRILDTQSADKAVFDLYRNPSVSPYWKDHKVTLDVAVAGNDSEAGGVIASSVGRLTQGVFTPSFTTDEGFDVGRPAVVLGLYSNSWIHKYWEHTYWLFDVPAVGGVFLPDGAPSWILGSIR